MNPRGGPAELMRQKRSALLAVAIIIVIAFGQVTFFASSISPALHARDELAGILTGARQALAEAQAAQVMTPDQLKTQIAEPQATLIAAYDAFLADLQGDLVLHALYQYASASGVTITDLQTQTSSSLGQKTVYNITTARLRATGSGRSLVDFAARISEAASKSFLIDSVNMATVEGSSILTMDIRLFTSPNAAGRARP